MFLKFIFINSISTPSWAFTTYQAVMDTGHEVAEAQKVTAYLKALLSSKQTNVN